MSERTNIYFVSDAHLGFPNFEKSVSREKKLVELLNLFEKDAKEIILLGDIFDFWFEYKRVIPKGFTRLLGKLSQLTDSGITVRFFTGNHDMWCFGYFEQECGVIIHRDRYLTTYNNKRFFIAHGDGLGPGDKGYKRLKAFFSSKTMQWIFARFHPNFSFLIAQKWSFKSRMRDTIEDYTFQGIEKERLIQYAIKKQETEPYDFYVFGHRHVPIEMEIEGGAKFISLGDWLHHFTYGVFDGNTVSLKKWEND